MKIESKSQAHNDFRKTLLLNISLASNKVGDFKISIDKCTEALYIDKGTVKAYFLRAQAYSKLMEYDLALTDIKEAIKLSPGDKALRDEFENIKSAKKKELDEEKAKAQKLFAQGLYSEKAAPKIEKKESGLPEFNPENPQVFMDIEVGQAEGEAKKSRVVFELFKSHTPKTSENFRVLCTGERADEDNALHFRGGIFHRIIKDFMMQGGDTTNRNGTGGRSIYGHKFDDEGVWLPHTTGGLLSMANSGKNTNGSQFFITYQPTAWLDGKHTVFGRVISGFEICKDAEAAETGASDLPKFGVTIVDCGELSGDDKLSKDEIELVE
jgi:cyclophilin family peptidyl-prolyl cis-trans isomerase